MVTARALTAEDLLMKPEDGFRYELIEGELVRMAPTGGQHGVVVVNITAPLASHVKTYGLGVVCGAETGFRISSNPDSVLAPDASYISKERIPPTGPPATYWEGAPDLAIEVASPSDSVKSLEAKARRWLEAGAKAVWALFPAERRVMTYPAVGPATSLSEDENLDGGSVVPGLTVRVRDLFR
ncbi:MAG: Uma2 family endonuclease [Blastocatellia bacterium]